MHHIRAMPSASVSFPSYMRVDRTAIQHELRHDGHIGHVRFLNQPVLEACFHKKVQSLNPHLDDVFMTSSGI